MRYTAAFKAGLGPGTLRWLSCDAADEKEATIKLKQRAPGLNLYGGPMLENIYTKPVTPST